MTFTIPNEADAFHSDQSEPDSRDFGGILAVSLGLTGVVSGCEVTAQGTPDMTVAVAAGVAIVAGTSATVSAGNVTITAADATNPRFDLICVASDGTKSAVAGTAAANPVFADPAGKAVIAAVYVPANDTTIASNQIVDKRVIIKPWVQLAGDTMTGNLTILNTAATAALALEGDGQQASSRITTFGSTSATVPLNQLLLRRARNTKADPRRTQSGDLLGRVGGTGYSAADDSSVATGQSVARASIEFRAAEAFTATAQGGDIRFSLTPIGSLTGVEYMRLLNFSGDSFSGLYLDEIQNYASNKSAKIAVQKDVTNIASVSHNGVFSRIRRYGSGATGSAGAAAFYGSAQHGTAVASISITNVVDNGSGLCRVTATGHLFSTNDIVAIGNVGGATQANGVWTITKIDANTFDLVGSSAPSAYTSLGNATTAGSLTGLFASVTLVAPRVLSGATGSAADGDDANGVTVWNGSTVGAYSGTTAFYQGRNSPQFNDTGEYEWGTAFDAAAYNQYWAYGGAGRLGAGGAFIEACRTDYDDSTCMWLQAPKDIWAKWADGDGYSNRINFVKYDTANARTEFGTNIHLPDTNISLGTTTGTKIGTATTQKLAFFNSTPIVQPASTTDLRTALINLGLVATGGASPLNLNGGAFTTTGAASVGTLAATDTITITDAKNIVLGSSTGNQIGTATTQKLGFWGKAPVVQLSAYTPTNVSADRAFNANSTTIDELADVLGTLIADLQLVGLLG